MASVFKSAATKIAHNTTIPALAGNSDLRSLQDLITAEKAVIASLQNLKINLAKAGDALRIWGQGEGDDLSDIFAASSRILVHFSDALTSYSSLHQAVRDSMKAVRTREEALTELRHRHRNVGASAEATEKKLNKISPGHKNFSVQTSALNKFREELRTLDADVPREETELRDYKRKCARDWMGLKFGGLVACCEKGVIVGDIGRQIMQSIPEEATQPDFPPTHYSAHGRVADLVKNAKRAVSQVTFSSNPTERVAALALDRPLSLVARDAPVQSPLLTTTSSTFSSDPTERASTPTSQRPPSTPQDVPQSPLLATTPSGVPAHSTPWGLPPDHASLNTLASVNELGIHGPMHPTPQFSSWPAIMQRTHRPSLVGPTQPFLDSIPYDNGVLRAKSQSLTGPTTLRSLSLKNATFHQQQVPDEPVPKYEPRGSPLRTLFSNSDASAVEFPPTIPNIA